MKTDAITMTLLYDYYADLLTEKQKTCFDLYYNQDLSLGEIAENEGISRQGVHDSIARAESAMLVFEEKTGCVRRAGKLSRAFAALSDVALALETKSDSDSILLAARLREAADLLKE